jgi:hypothetical protein
LRLTWLWSHGTNLDHYYYYNNVPSTYVWEAGTGTAISTANSNALMRPYDKTTWGGNTWDVKNGWSNDNALQINYQRLFHHGVAYQVAYVWSKPMRMGGNYSRDGVIYPYANYQGALGSAGTVTLPAGTISPVLPPAPPTGTQSWQEYHALDAFEQYIVDTAIPKQHITFNGVVDLPIGKNKRFLGNVPRWADAVVGGWQIAGAGQIVSQDFTVTSTNWGPTNPLQVYKNKYAVTDCTGTICHPERLWFNGYIAPSSIGKISGLPSSYVANQAASIAYSSPINPSTADNNVSVTLKGATTPTTVSYSPGPAGSNPYSKTVLNGPINWNADASVFKVIRITEKTLLRFNADAFNVFNVQGYTNPSGTTGLEQIQPGASVASSYWTARQLQLTLRLQF